MKNSDLARKIKDVRSRKGFSQEELAEKAGISLRTVQRIENGETEARGDTLKRLANALNITPDELINWTEKEDKDFLVILNLSALSFIAFPLLGIIVPLSLWVLKKDKIKYVNETGKRLLNFQISWCIFFGVIYFIFVGSIIFHFKHHVPLMAITIIVALIYLFNLVLVLVNTIRSINTQVVIYQPAIPFLK